MFKYVLCSLFLSLVMLMCAAFQPHVNFSLTTFLFSLIFMSTVFSTFLLWSDPLWWIRRQMALNHEYDQDEFLADLRMYWLVGHQQEPGGLIDRNR